MFVQKKIGAQSPSMPMPRKDVLLEASRRRALRPPSAKEKRIVLIKPPLYTCETFAPIRSAQPLGIWQLGSYLKSKGYEVMIIDSVIEGWENKAYLENGKAFNYRETMLSKTRALEEGGPEGLLSNFPVISEAGEVRRSLIRTGLPEQQIVDKIRDFDPGWIGLSIIATAEHRGAIDLSRRLRKEFPDSVILAGGQHATAMPEIVIADSGGSIDLVVRGKGEGPMERLLSGMLPEQGIAYFQNGNLIELPPAHSLPLELLPIFDPFLLSGINYPFPATHSFNTMGRKYTDIMFSFGCHRRCPFCCNQVNYRHISTDKLNSQLRALRENGYEELILQDDSLFGGPKDDGKAFFKMLVKAMKSFGFHWHDNGGASMEEFGSDLVDSILRANESPGEGGCTALYVPFNPRFVSERRVVEKYFSKMPEKFQFLKKLMDNGVYVFTSGIWGHVGQDLADMRSDIDGYEELIRNGVVGHTVIFGLSYFPGTQDWNYRDNIVDMQDWEGFSIFPPHAGTRRASFEEVTQAVLEAHMRLNRIHQVEPWCSGFPTHIPEGW